MPYIHRPSARKFIAEHEAGAAYVYMNYGVHWLLNVLGEGLRATDSSSSARSSRRAGVREMERRRLARAKSPLVFSLHALCSGPGKLAQALGGGWPRSRARSVRRGRNRFPAARVRRGRGDGCADRDFQGGALAVAFPGARQRVRQRAAARAGPEKHKGQTRENPVWPLGAGNSGLLAVAVRRSRRMRCLLGRAGAQADRRRGERNNGKNSHVFEVSPPFFSWLLAVVLRSWFAQNNAIPSAYFSLMNLRRCVSLRLYEDWGALGHHS